MTAGTPNPRIQRTFNILLFGLFLVGIWAPFTTLLVRGTMDPEMEGAENRAWVPFPELTWSWESIRSFPDRYEVYVDNQFGLRDILIRWHSRLCVGIYTMSPSPKVRLGLSDWLYFNGDEAGDDGSPIQDYTGLHPLQPAQLEALRMMYQDQSDFLRARGMRYMLVLIPTKPFIYPEYLPGNVIRARDTSWREQLVTHLRAHSDVEVLDLGPALLAARDTEPLFFRTDTHWNPAGGYLASVEIIRALQPWFPQLAPKPDSMYVRTPHAVKRGDLARLMNLQDAFEETFVNLAPGPEARGQNQILSDHKFPGIAGGNGDPDSPTAQVYRDSFGDYLYPFLSEYFHRVGYEWGQRGSRMRGIESAHPDVVLQISCDRILGSALLSAPRIREEGSRLRFERARPVARYSAADGFEALDVSHRAASRTLDDGLGIYAPEGRARITLPLELDAATQLPILRLEIRPEKPGYVSITSPRQPRVRGMRPPEVGLGRFRLERGRNIFHVTLTDPGIQDHVTLDFGDAPGSYLLHAAELRALPRWEQAPAAR